MRGKITYTQLYLFSVNVGLKAIFVKGKLTKESLKRVICPMDIPRYYELPKVANALDFDSGSMVLDISSPKLLVYYLAKKFPDVTFYSVDKFKNELDSWNEIVGSQKNLIISKQDAINLRFKKEFFDQIFSISVIEHVNLKKDKGDVRMVKEAYRVLRKGGKFVLTTMVAKTYKEIFLPKKLYSSRKSSEFSKKKFFFARVYDYKTIKTNILNVTHFKITTEEFCVWKMALLEKIYIYLFPISVFFGLSFILFAPYMVNIKKNSASLGKRNEYFCVLSKS